MGAVLAAIAGVWLVTQAVSGRLAARILSYREVRPGEVPAPDLGAGLAGAVAGVNGLAGAAAAAGSGQVLTIDQVAAVALAVGLSPDAAVTATAIAMRESGGNTAAHNPVPPDDSYGLWQINRLAHPQYSPAQLTTAAGNAAAMFELSRGGTNWGPWQIGGNPLARTDPAAARAAVARVSKAA